MNENTIYLWIINLDSIPFSPHIRTILSLDERKKMNSFATPKLKQNYGKCHAIKRFLFSKYLGSPHHKTVCNQYGKPFLSHPYDKIKFNLSHSGNMFTIAIANNIDLGIDIEKTKTRSFLIDIEQHFCHKEEINKRKQLHNNETETFFLKVWTGKEAYLKYKGFGLTQVPLTKLAINGLDTQGTNIHSATIKYFSHDDYIVSLAFPKDTTPFITICDIQTEQWALYCQHFPVYREQMY